MRSIHSLLSVFCHSRFIQMAPQYFYYNMPSSESKELLQHVLDGTGSCSKVEEEQKASAIDEDTDKDCTAAEQTYDRCTIQ